MPSTAGLPAEFGEAPDGDDGSAAPADGTAVPDQDVARSDDETQASSEPSAGDPSDDGGNVTPARESTHGDGLPAGVYHSAEEASQPISLEIGADSTWAIGYQGCDSSAYTEGQVIPSAAGWDLVPNQDCTPFWIGASAFLTVAQLHVELVDDALLLSGDGDDAFEASLAPGGRCARCGSMGPEEVFSCDDPIRRSECF